MSDTDSTQIILDRLSEIHTDLGHFRKECTASLGELKQRTTAVETVVQPFFANDGGREKTQEQIDSLNKTKWYGLGFVAAITTGGHWLLHKLGI